MCYYEGCKKGILFHWKSNGIACYGLQVRYWECFASVFIPVFGWICKCKYDQHLLCEFFSFLSFFLCFFPSVFLFRSHCFFNTYCSFLCYLECFFCYYFIVVNVGTRACICPRVLCLLRMKEKCSWSFFLYVVAHLLSFVNQFVRLEEDPFL